MKVVLLTLDPRSAQKVHGEVVKQLDECGVDYTLTAVVSASTGDPSELVVPRARISDFPGDSLDIFTRAKRVAFLSAASRRVWRHVSKVFSTLATADADLVVAGDELSIRSAWHASRRLGVLGWARPVGLKVAVKRLT